MKPYITILSACTAAWLVTSGCSHSERPVTALVPAPAEMTVDNGSRGVRVSDITAIYAADSTFAAACGAFIADAADMTQAVMTGNRSSARVIVAPGGNRPEGYRMTAGPDSIVITATDPEGAAHALASLRQLMEGNRDGRLPVVTIEDYPQWSYRGVMIDCSRHFWTPDQLRRIISAMSLFKLNVLHLHLSDNQGWRLYLDKHPDLTDKGTYYYDFPERSGKFYTPSELKELVSYAGDRGIEIIPEIDMPGHCLALLAARPDLSCRGGEFETYQDEREQKDRKRLSENMVCIGNEAVFDLAGDILDQLVEIFPSKYIHTGGDEVSTHVWQTCSKCRGLFHREGMKEYVELQDYFTRRIGRMVSDRGRIMIGWEEINDRGAALDDNLITIWQGKPMDILDKAVARGIDVVMCPKDPCYFDFSYTRNPSKKIYGWDPAYGHTDSLTVNSIRGGQACLWTEFVPTPSDLQQMLFPRLCALAEVLWSPAETRDWDSYLARMATVEPILGRMGIDTFTGENPDDRWFNAADFSADSVTMALPASIETNMNCIKGYEKEFAFDCDTVTFYSSPYSHLPGDYMTVRLDSAQELSSIRVISDLLSDGFTDGAELSISTDGESFEIVAVPDSCGQLHASFETPRSVSAVKIELTKSKNSRLTIKEIELK